VAKTIGDIVRDVQGRFPKVHAAVKPSPAKGYTRVTLLGSEGQAQRAEAYLLELAAEAGVRIHTERVTQLMCKKSAPTPTQPSASGQQAARMVVLDRDPTWGVSLLCINADDHARHRWDLPPK